MRLKFIIDKEYDKSFITTKKDLQYLCEQYNTGLLYLNYTKREYQKSWDIINDDFFAYIENITGYEWSYFNYECVVSVIHDGVSNWGTNNRIIRGWRENPFSQRRITAHELLISHYFTIYNKFYKKEKLNNKQVWMLAEIAAFALTSLTAEVKKFWPWDTEYYYDHNYPNIIFLQKKLKKIFIRRRNFDDYIKKGIVIIKKQKFTSK